MGKIKIHEIAKKLNINSKDVLEIAKKLGVEAKSHLSSIDEKDAEKIEREFNNEKNDGSNSKITKTSGPVIIRREVIISDEELEKRQQEEEKKKREAKKEDIGFVQNKRKTDFNIVYRNKPVKPLTVNELFGIKTNDKEEKKKEPVVEENTEKVIQNVKQEINIEKPKQQPKQQQNNINVAN